MEMLTLLEIKKLSILIAVKDLENVENVWRK
jgi:hypothetical protein